MFEGVPDPIQTEAKEAFICTVGAVNQAGFLLGDDQQALADDSQIGQAGSQEETAQADWIRQMAFVKVKSPAFLAGKEGFNLETSAIIFAGLIATGQIGHQVERSIVTTAPPPNEVQSQRCAWRETNLIALKYMPFFQWIRTDCLAFLPFAHINLWRCEQSILPGRFLFNPRHHFARIVLSIAQQNYFAVVWYEWHYLSQGFDSLLSILLTQFHSIIGDLVLLHVTARHGQRTPAAGFLQHEGVGAVARGGGCPVMPAVVC